MKKTLSILLPTLPLRIDKLASIVNSLNTQINQYNYNDLIQILIDGDTKEITIGEKRNRMVKNAIGEYIIFIDDDDKISSDYVPLIMSALQNKPDCVTFKAEYIENGSKKKDVIYSLQFTKNWSDNKNYYRLPNHLCCVKREIALKCPFPDKQFGEDDDYSFKIKKMLKKECHINSNLYFYLFNEKESQTHPKGKKNAFK